MKKLMILLLLLAFLPRPAAALSTDELLSLVVMPLAVAAVADLTDVPTSDLVDLVTLMNGADVQPTEFVQVIRYVPVALVVEDTQPDFVQFVRTQTDQGLRSTALVNVIEQRLVTFDIDQTAFRDRRVVVVDNNFIPPVVLTRITQVRQHPHGGPPGQLKKQLGLQTGAEVVHRERRDAQPTIIVTKPAKPAKVKRIEVDDDHGRGHENHVRKENQGHGHDGDKGGKGGKGNKGGKGKGKGKG